MQSQAETNITERGISVRIEIGIALIADILMTGFDDGISYWARRAHHRIPDHIDLEEWRDKNGFTSRFSHDPQDYETPDFYLAPFVGGSIIFEEWGDGDKPIVRELNLRSIERGLRIMAAGGPDGNKWPCGSQHFADMLSGNEDATTGDVFVQCCVFGDIIYG